MPKLHQDTSSGNFYSRVTIPADVRHLLDNKREFKRRYGSRGKKEVQSEHHEFCASAYRQIEEARRQLADQQRLAALPAKEARKLKRLRQPKEGLIPFSQSDFPEYRCKQLVTEWFTQERRKSLETDTASAQTMGTSNHEYKGLIHELTIERDVLSNHDGDADEEFMHHVRAYTDKILEAHGYYVALGDYNTEPYRTMERYARLGWMELFQHRLHVLKDAPIRDYAYHAPASFLYNATGVTGAPRNTLDMDHSMTWQELVTDFTKAKSMEVSNKKTVQNYTTAIRIGTEVFGADKPIGLIDRELCHRWLDAARRTPSNITKIKEIQGMSLQESAEYADKHGLPTLSENTVKNQLKNLKAIFNYAVDEGQLLKSPAKKLNIKVTQVSNDERRYSVEQLNKILTTPWFEYFRDNRFDGSRKSEDCWLTLLALFTGARANELCQLLVADTHTCTHNGKTIHYIDISEEMPSELIALGVTKKLKNDSSRRSVPIHPTLIQLGIAQYIYQQSGHHLFPEVNRSENPSDAFSKRYAHFLSNSAGKQRGDKINFHSYRHTVNYFATKAPSSSMDKHLSERMLGWSERGQSKTYGGDVSVEKLYDNLCLLELSLIHI